VAAAGDDLEAAVARGPVVGPGRGLALAPAASGHAPAVASQDPDPAVASQGPDPAVANQGRVPVAVNPAPATAARGRGPVPANRGRPPATVTAVPPAPSGNAPNPTEEDPAPGRRWRSDLEESVYCKMLYNNLWCLLCTPKSIFITLQPNCGLLKAFLVSLTLLLYQLIACNLVLDERILFKFHL